MPGRNSVIIPNTTDPNVDGTPNPAPVVVDDTSETGAGPFLQQFSPSTWLRSLLSVLAPFGTAFDPLGGRLRVLLDAGGGAQTLATVTTVTTVTGITNIGGFSAQSFINDTMYATWATAIRGRVT